MTDHSDTGSERILVVAPLGADASNVIAILKTVSVSAVACPNVTAVVGEMTKGCGAVLLTEEALNDSRYGDLAAALSRQPPWSDIPVILIVSGGRNPNAIEDVLRLVGPQINATLMERPLRRATLLSTVQAALRARRRQYEVATLLREREEWAATLERRVLERTARLEELNAELEAFSYSVSHDLRAPLRSVETYAKILRDEHGESMSPEGRHFADRIARNAEKMDRLMQDVLTFSRMARSEMPLQAVDLDRVLEDVIEQYPDLSDARPHLAVQAPLGRVWGNPASLAQCFSNLLQNAIKFIPPDRAPAIRVHSQPVAARRLRVYVRDNGRGIDPAHHARIFGMFERASSADIPGTGIGLAIVKKAMERMGGAVGVESAMGAGATFWLELPTVESAE